MTMFLFSFRLCLYSLILSIYTTSITSLFIDFNAGQPATFWVDQSCLLKGFTSTTVQESLNIATRGSYRVINRNDGYQGWLFQKLFKVARVFNVDPTEDTVAWVVVGEQLPMLLDEISQMF